MIWLSLLAAAVTFQPGAERVDVSLEGKPLATFRYGGEWAKPFLHAIHAPSGVVVTRTFPVEKVEGEIQDHAWHHGLWWAHGDINGVDFWRDKGPALTGRMVLEGRPRMVGDSLQFTTRLVTPEKKTLGTVEQVMRFARSGGANRIDVEVTVRADQGVALKLGDTEEGALGFRFADSFKEDRGAALTNSEGQSGTKQIWGKRARWVDYSTTIGGAGVGVTIFDHPKNPKYPTYWHARGYGLNAANPFGEHDFHKDKTRDGSLTVAAGASLQFRYRVVVHDGALNREEAERQAKEYGQ